MLRVGWAVLGRRGVHYEVELGLVIGKTVRDLREGDEEGAREAVSGMFEFLYGITVELGREVRVVGWGIHKEGT